jgi:3-oxoacyl-[acyl-carrier protein] reductase
MTVLQLREQDLAGKVGVITGASRGIGRAISMNLASRGCSILGTCSSTENVGLIDAMDKEMGALFKVANHSHNPKIKGISANILLPTCAQTIVDALIQHFSGRVDIMRLIHVPEISES